MERNLQRQSVVKNAQIEREPYEKPAVIYEGLITTMSKSGPDSSPKGNVDPADVFKGSDG